MSPGTRIVPIPAAHRPLWQLHLEAFEAAAAAVRAAIAEGQGAAGQRYAARRHQAHAVWAAWALAEARSRLGLPGETGLPALGLCHGQELPLAIPERPGLTLRGLPWPPEAGNWGLLWRSEALILEPAPALVSAGPIGVLQTTGRPRVVPLLRCRWPAIPGWLPLAGMSLLGLPPAFGAGEDAGPAAVVYEAQRGETLWLVAERLWGDGRTWPALWALNRQQVPNPGFLAAGTVLRLPAAVPAPVALAAPPHRVWRGDTLWAVAGRTFGDSGAWPLLWGWNRDQVADPDRIYPGQALRWPRSGDLAVVAPGDTLWGLAQARYGSGRRWGRLWQANRGWLRRPEALQAGQRLWVPGG